jgi:hypothetical protein
MSLAKNIKLAAGTIGAWEECVLEDLQKDRFTFYEFILATKKVIREPVFNRIDYADIYQLAKSIADDRKRLTPTKIDLSGGDTMPQNIKDMISPIGKRI